MSTPAKVNSIFKQANSILLGKERETRLALISLFCQGHLLIEDLPGVGKTTLVRLLGKLFGFQVSRIQFTSDLLPSDIIGANIYNKDSGEFSFKPGPLFGGFVLADELNRATPRTQSALLQAMEERSVSVDGTQHILDDSFLVVATQNPKEQIGTFALPESQLDRFFMSLFLDFPNRNSEREILKNIDPRSLIEKIEPVCEFQDLIKIREDIKLVKGSDALYDYILDLLDYGRRQWEEGLALSPRAGQDLVAAAKANAYIEGRDFMLPEDVQAIAAAVLGHRLGGTRGVRFGFKKANQLIEVVKIP